MKANELMIGDLVTFKDCQYDDDVVVVKIYQINQENNALVFIDDSDSLDEIDIDDEIVGIHITPEILEKNGFEKDKEYPEQWCIAGEFQDVYVHEWSDSIWKVEIVNFEFSSMPVSQCTVCFVHELQHAFKLCGIEKTIDL